MKGRYLSGETKKEFLGKVIQKQTSLGDQTKSWIWLIQILDRILFNLKRNGIWYTVYHEAFAAVLQQHLSIETCPLCIINPHTS